MPLNTNEMQIFLMPAKKAELRRNFMPYRSGNHRIRPAADLRTAGGTVSYRQFSAPHKLAFQAAGIARVYALPPWNRLDPVAIRQR